MKHTPTPWEILFSEDEDGVAFGIIDDECRDIAFDVSEANAAHIVKCVNHFDELVALVEDVASNAGYSYCAYGKRAAELLEKVQAND